MSDRDPKVDPIRGDALVCRNKIRYVRSATTTRVVYEAGLSSQTQQQDCTLLEWRAWAVTAKVIRKGREQLPEVVQPEQRLSPDELLSRMFSTK